MIKTCILIPFAIILLLLLHSSKVEAQIALVHRYKMFVGMYGTKEETSTEYPLCNSNPCFAGLCFNSSNGQSYTCDCFTGFQGVNCEQVMLNPCASNPCFAGQCTYSNRTLAYQCNCNSGWSGQYCDIVFNFDHFLRNVVTDACTNNPCWAGECLSISNGTQYVCVCDSGYTGSRCQERITDGCQDQPCWAGTCQPTGDQNFTCNCVPGYTGKLCDQKNSSVFPCASNPCFAGTCVSREFSSGKFYVCQCPPSYTGERCESVRNNHPCQKNNCLFGTCQATSSVFYKCNCYQGFTGARCDQADETVLPCYVNPCQHDGTCTNTNAGTNYTCTCQGRFTGRNCDTIINDFCSDNPCGNRGICLDIGDRHQCVCNPGYKGSNCQDIVTLAPTTAPTPAATEAGCGGTYTQNTGIIRSPRYPKDYTGNLDCTYQIIAGTNQTIQLEWIDFELEAETLSICYDSLTVYDGQKNTNNEVSQYCGTNLPSNYHSRGHVLTLNFQSDSFISNKGFEAHYTLVNESHSPCFSSPCKNGGSCQNEADGYSCSCTNGYIGRNCQSLSEPTNTMATTDFACGGSFISNNGTIMSSNYPNKYDSSSECYYRIQLDTGNKIQLDWLDFDVEGSQYRCYDRVEVFDGSIAGIRLLNSTCGNQLPPSLTSSGSTMTLAFYSDLSINYKGFKARYKSIQAP
ncbi:Tolloid-like protein 1 [Trichoplax sp. H2]|nr:Tolloid-like protein 1 [Trichoplax sp. H2]|eukprot:RDD39578.1 Tolloid-like protein 1 [Trichoplax sp. H2]